MQFVDSGTSAMVWTRQESYQDNAYEAWPQFGHGLAAVRCRVPGFL